MSNSNPSNPFPSFHFYPHDWRSGHSTGEMTLEQKGLFIDLLAWAWDAEPPCSIPDDDARLALISGLKKRWKRVGGPVKAQFLPIPDHPGRLRNAKQWRVLQDMLELRKKRSVAGQKGSDKRWPPELQTDGNADGNGHSKEDSKAIATGWPSVSGSSSSSRKTSPNSRPDIPFGEESRELKAARHLFGRIKENNPSAKEPKWQQWAKDFDRIFRLDARPEADVLAVIDWCQGDSFWLGNILSPAKLREQYDQLILKMRPPTPKVPSRVVQRAPRPGEGADA